MKTKKKLIIWIALLFILSIVGFNIVYSIFKDDTRLSSSEQEWVNGNLNKVLNVSVLNDTNVFGSNGKGVFFDFLTDFSTEYGLKINTITYNKNDSHAGVSFAISNILNPEDLNFYEDHYVLVSKSTDTLKNPEDLSNLKIGVLKEQFETITAYFNKAPSFTGYDTKETLIEALNNGNDINAMIVPRIEFMDTILSKDYRINYHFTNLHRYYNLVLDKNDENFSNILKKYFSKWSLKDYADSLHQWEFQMFINRLNIPQTEVDKLQSVVYNYGFINNSPYEILTGGNYGGIIASYLHEFSSFSSVEFNFKRFGNYKKLVSAIDEGKIDLYFGYQNFTTKGTDVLSDILLKYDVLVPIENSFVISSLKSLKDQTIYVEANSFLHSKLISNSNFKIETYESENGLKDVIRKKGILVMDHNLSSYYQKSLLKNYSVRYTSNFDATYVFKSQANETFTKLFSRYINYLDENKMNYVGIYNHSVTMKKGTILGTIAQYFLYVIGVLGVLIFIIYRSSKRIRLTKKIRREDKMRFIDQLTSLKNRNYLNENIVKWNKNGIYPQTMIVLDLNRVQEINDTFGYEKGDAQIKSAANILIKTQLDNSDIVRTDGNEFMIYLVGYQSKQITSFIHKLSKEFKSLPYDYGARIGYSMIHDDLKSIEDAINEAIEDIKKQKENQKEA